MPKMSLKVGQAEVYVAMGQLEEATAKLINAQQLQNPRPAIAAAAASIAAFVEETHGFLAAKLKDSVTTDLRHCALALRAQLLASSYGKDEQNKRMNTLKSLLRLHSCYAELRHYDH